MSIIEEKIQEYIKPYSNIIEISYHYPKIIYFGDDDKNITLFNIRKYTEYGLDKINNYNIGDPLIDKIFPDNIEVLYLDTVHNYDRLIKELKIFGGSVKNVIIITRTEKYKNQDERGYGPGVLRAINEFIEYDGEWNLVENITEGEGLMILKRGNETNQVEDKMKSKIRKSKKINGND